MVFAVLDVCLNTLYKKERISKIRIILCPYYVLKITHKPSIRRRQSSCHSRLELDVVVSRCTPCRRRLNIHRCCRSQNSHVDVDFHCLYRRIVSLKWCVLPRAWSPSGVAGLEQNLMELLLRPESQGPLM